MTTFARRTLENKFNQAAEYAAASAGEKAGGMAGKFAKDTAGSAMNYIFQCSGWDGLCEWAANSTGSYVKTQVRKEVQSAVRLAGQTVKSNVLGGASGALQVALRSPSSAKGLAATSASAMSTAGGAASLVTTTGGGGARAAASLACPPVLVAAGVAAVGVGVVSAYQANKKLDKVRASAARRCRHHKVTHCGSLLIKPNAHFLGNGPPR